MLGSENTCQDITFISHRSVLARIIQLFRQALQTPGWGHIKCWYRDCHLNSSVGPGVLSSVLNALITLREGS